MKTCYHSASSLSRDNAPRHSETIQLVPCLGRMVQDGFGRRLRLQSGQGARDWLVVAAIQRSVPVAGSSAERKTLRGKAFRVRSQKRLATALALGVRSRGIVVRCPVKGRMHYGSRSSSLSPNDAARLSRVPSVARNDPDLACQLRAEPEDHRQVAASDHDHRLADGPWSSSFGGAPSCRRAASRGACARLFQDVPAMRPCISAVQRPLKHCRHLFEGSGSCRWHVPPAKGREESLQAQRSRLHASQRCHVPLAPAHRADRSWHGPYRPDPRTAAAVQEIEAHFSSHIFHGACDTHGINHRLTKPCHPSRPS
jgi:hypothetical protein